MNVVSSEISLSCLPELHLVSAYAMAWRDTSGIGTHSEQGWTSAEIIQSRLGMYMSIETI
jgi:hypothetical protein